MMTITDLFLLNSATLAPALLQTLESELNPVQHLQWQGVVQPHRRREFLISRVVINRLLAQRLGQDPQKLQFCSGPHGKPMLAGQGSQRCHFNLSHSGDWLAIAIGEQGPIGVDLELGRRARSPLPLAQRFFAPAEYQYLAALPKAQQAGSFYRLWSRKEAVLKAHGGGIAAGLEKVEFVPQQGWRLVNRLDGIDYRVQDWPWQGGWLSLAGSQDDVRLHRLDEQLEIVALQPHLDENP
ncbi:4'-phosphopantetheinyl transferase family protein [Aeromonas bivalvium]|uniref:4'-phosphopantetheinyl transferase family protein n=1 Tax=Aeromonas bivalvium TaxID=440079 RepID=UPI00370AB7C0